MSRVSLGREDHLRIQKAITLQGDEVYSVVTHRIYGVFKRSIHVFGRLPATKELIEYAETVAGAGFRDQARADLGAGRIRAAEALYDRLVEGVYDLPIGEKTYGEVNMKDDGSMEGTPLCSVDARATVPVMVKREALRDCIGAVYSESRLDRRQSDDEEAIDDLLST